MVEMVIGLISGGLLVIVGVFVGTYITYRMREHKPLIGEGKITILSRTDDQLVDMEKDKARALRQSVELGEDEE